MLSRDMASKIDCMRCMAYVERCGGVDPIGQIEHVYVVYAGLFENPSYESKTRTYMRRKTLQKQLLTSAISFC
jgi:hypothetical protein